MKNDRKKEKRLAAPFFIALAILAAAALILPLRPTRSETEKRELTRFPSFTWESFLRGEYLSDVGLWFSDTFPGRDGWLAAHREIQSVHGLSDTAVSLNALGAAADTAEDLDALLSEPVVTPSPTAAATPVVTQTPEVTEAPEVTPSPAPTAEPWAGFGLEEERELYGASILIDGSVFTQLTFCQGNADNHIAMMNAFGDALAAEGIRFFNLPVPTGAGVLLSPELREELGCADQGKLLLYMFQREGENVYKVNALDELLAHKREYLYFHSDHHWTALGAYYAYVAFCRSAGFEPVPLSEYKEVSMGDYIGAFWYTLGLNTNMRDDEVIAYVPPGDITMDVWGLNDLRNGTWGPVLDRSGEPDNMKYLCFIAGDNPVTVITNHDLPDAPDCVVLKDSFANPFVVYLTQHYHTVHVLDYRSYRNSVRLYALDVGAEDVILCQDISITQTYGPQTLLPDNLW